MCKSSTTGWYRRFGEEGGLHKGRRTVKQAVEEFLKDYQAKHRAPVFAEYALGHVTEVLGDRLVLEVTPGVVKKYQTDQRLLSSSPT